jgi:hypothetical protein
MQFLHAQKIENLIDFSQQLEKAIDFPVHYPIGGPQPEPLLYMG